MSNDEVIRKLLNFVRIKKDNLQVFTPDREWIDLTLWREDLNKFSSYRHNNVSTTELITKLRDYFYKTFYLTGEIEIIKYGVHGSLDKITPNVDSLSDQSDRPRSNDFAVLIENTNRQIVLIEQDNLRLKAEQGEYITDKATQHPVIVQLAEFSYRTKEPTDVDSDGSPDYYWTDCTQRGFNNQDRYARFYFNPIPGYEEQIADALLQLLDFYSVSFTLKFLCPGKSEYQCDRIVLYVSVGHCNITSWIVRSVYLNFKALLRDKLPLFVKQLSPMHGIGFAEDPFVDESFGESRCTWLAFSIVEYFLQSDSSQRTIPLPADQIIDDMVKQQNIKNISLLHLNQETFYKPYPYNFEIFRDSLESAFNLTPLLNEPQIVANFICREAIWTDANTCTWVNATPNRQFDPVYSPVKLDWETGRLGIILFLYVLNKYVSNALYSHVINCSVIDLKAEILKADARNQEYLLALFEYSPMISDSLDQRLTLEKANKQNFQVKDELFRDKVPTEDREVYEFLLDFLKRDLQKPTQLSAVFLECLKNITDKSRLYWTNYMGFNDFMPGMNGLALTGFSYLLSCDPMLPRVPVETLLTEP